MKTTKFLAFTLIELSIVLVIIGLIAGGILVGKDLIRQAELRKIVKITEDLNLKMNTFRLKYNAIPGELLTYAQFFSTLIGPYCPKTTFMPEYVNNILDTTYEREAAFAQLNAAGLLSVERPQILQNGTVLSYYDCYYNSMQQQAGFFSPRSAYGMITSSGLLTGIQFGTGAEALLTVGEAMMLDQKYDDGKPSTGKIRGLNSAAGGYCVDTPTAYYTIDFNKQTCIMQIFGSQ